MHLKLLIKFHHTSRQRACLAAVMFALCLPGQAAPDDSKELEQRLRDQLANKTLMLRQPYIGEKLQFDAEGNLRGPAELGGWTGDGYFQVGRVEVRGDSLRLKGKRLVGFYDQRGNWQLAWKEQDLRLEFTFAPGTLNEAAAQSALVRVFGDASHVQIPRPPPDLGNFRSDSLEIRQDKAFLCRLAGSQEWKPCVENLEPIAIGELEDGEKLYVITKAVRAPRPVETVDPEFGEEARREKRNGEVKMRVIINDAGRIHSMQVDSADTLEFALQAARAISRWKFEPAKLAGRPVAVTVIIEVIFRLA